ncbi:hypothetical protein CK203_075291 [Vitis vinifera]|uniref:Uncharacterized protein n=1 Tax=Vitis vinifera TaxID=29760 RepID=A0A438BXD5_VITVI|nr:hypothetical protein CK203_075291 [Vitis vinifera]
MDRARARSNPDKIASYSASLLEAGIPTGWLAPSVPLLGTVAEARLRTRMIHEVSHYLAFHGQSGWNLIPNSLNSIAHYSILPVKSVCVECYEGVGRSARPPGGLGNRGGTSRQPFEGLRLLAPF